jgi:aminoglycoside phosphotransferase family enzyme/predicted kinase
MPTDQNNFANQQALVAALVNRHRLLPESQRVRLIETHISWVLLVGRYAYKIKKALDLGFLNFTNLDARRFYCSEEIRLNRRLAPKSYLEVIPIGGNFESPEFGLQPAIEYAVKMRRFASAKELDHLLALGKVKPLQMDQLAELLAAFHGKLSRANADSGFGTPEIIHAHVMENIEQLLLRLKEPVDLALTAKLKVTLEKAFVNCQKYFKARLETGFIRECHGDLHLGNIVLIGKNPVPFDSLEFDPALRWIDVIDEVAFLVMDLLHGQRSDLAYRFLNAFLELTGDFAGLFVFQFYLSHRAAVRAKVSAIRAIQPDASHKIQAQAMNVCRTYLMLAGECLAERRPALIITHGLPGSGKSTFAQVASERFRAIRLRSDVERKRIFGLNPLDNSHLFAGIDIYSAEATRKTYTRLYELAHEILNAGFPIIVDAAFLKQDEREQFHALAKTLSVPFAIVSLKTNEATLINRIKARNETANDASEADPAVLEKLKGASQPLLQHELLYTVDFINEADNSCLSTAVERWNRLEALIKLQ